MEQFQALIDWLDSEITALSDQWQYMAEDLARHLSELLPAKPEVCVVSRCVRGGHCGLRDDCDLDVAG
jgi:hypothetical protein